MEAFQQLLNTRRINIDDQTTYEFDFEDAPKAFDLVVNKTEPFIGLALKYNTENKQLKDPVQTNAAKPTGKINISFIGAGSYAQGNLLPNLPELKKFKKSEY